MSATSRRKSFAVAGVAVVGVAATVGAVMVVPTAQAAPVRVDCAADDIDTYAKIFKCITPSGIREHLQAFQDIADENGGNRAEQTPGYDASVDYVMETLTEAGWDVEKAPFTYEEMASSLSRAGASSTEFDSDSLLDSAEGSVTGALVAVDLAMDAPADNTSACEAEDFADLDFSGDADVALIQRGSCDFITKVTNAQDAGAEAVVIFNKGAGEGGFEALRGELGGQKVDVPVVGILSFADGQELAEAGGEVSVSVTLDRVDSYNVIATLPGEVDDNVVMAGAHLDSVDEGPGINDNGSGVAGLLETAQVMANTPRHNTVQFAFWGAEEIGLVGSTEWVKQLSKAELDTIALYLNFDMIGSPNHIFQVYDANESTFDASVDVPAGSEAIEKVFEQFYTARNLPYEDSEFNGRSDYQAFIDAGIPSGGLFTGAEQIKTVEQARIWGGTAGEPFDPCYHALCDNIDNINRKALLHNVELVASSVFTFQHSTAEVNGVEGIDIPRESDQPEPAGPQGTATDSK